MASINENLKATGQVSVVVTGPDGQVKDRRDIKNLVVAAGKNFIASRIAGAGGAVMSHMAVGTGGAAPAAGNTQLGSEVGRTALDTAGGTPADNAVTFAANFAAGIGTGALQEAGLFNSGSLNGGDMLARVSFPVINKGANDQITITWTVTIN